MNVSRIRPFLLLCIAVAAPVGASELRAYAGAVVGNAAGSGGPFACATSGPTIGDGWFAGISLPTEGFAGCGLAGGIVDKKAATGPLTANQSATGPMVGGVGSATVAAQARADYWSLGAAANGTGTGGTSAFTYHASAGFASFTDTLTLTSVGIATGTAGSTNFAFLVDGLMQSASNAPYTQQLDARLGIRVDDRFIWDSLRATLINEDLPSVRGGATGLPGSFVLGPGSLSGSALVTSTANFSFEWGVPFKVELALMTNASPCCYGTSQNAAFLNTALLKGIDAYGPGGKVTDFQVSAASGTRIGANGLLSPVPEPGT